MWLINKRYDEIQRCVANMFKENNITKIPVDVFEICRNKGIKLFKYSELNIDSKKCFEYLSEDGFCIYYEFSVNKGEWRIYYNDSKTDKRIRFTIMHEIAHIELDHTEHSELAESEANFFAKYALAPPPLIHQFKPQDYIDLAKSFNISYKTAFYCMLFYEKWLKYGSFNYLDYEIMLIKLFGLAG